MRDLKRSDRNRVEFDDTASASKLAVYYSTPTSSQVRAYRQASLKKKGNRVVFDNFDAAVKYGLEIMTGFDDGAFGIDGKPISSDPESPMYYPEWKDLLRDTAIDVILAVAAVAFDGVRAGVGDVDIGEEVLPLVKTSGD